ncbi:MAG: HD domain-containing protein [Nitrospiraceae bacterium]|nr:MAG: HD domain-containing protein [Nitrospiraceae bacterium]
METNNVQHDLSLTIHELSGVYEELSLLYRISEIYSSLSVDEICSRIIDEAISTINVKTAAVLFLDEKRENLYTKAYRGDWDGQRQFPKDDGVIWKALQSKKYCAFCRIKETEHRDYIPQINSLMVCPILGKVKAVGAIVVADKEFGQEFFSNDSKLLMAISTQAGLAIENAFLYSELETLLVGAIRCLVKALEATSYWTAGHTERVTEYAMGIGRGMDLESDMIEKLKICSLLHDIGKIATPKEILNKDDKLNEEEWLEIKKHPIVGAEILFELKQFKDVLLGVKYHHEHWDGQGGIFGLKQQEIPIMARILSVADTFDALTSDRPYRPKHSKEDAVSEIMRCSGTQFDPVVVEAFMRWVKT